MTDEQSGAPGQVPGPDQTAVRVALWRALHVELDAPPHVLADETGLRLADPADGWRDRPDMDPVFTSGFRASIVVRARFIEDLVAERAAHGTSQYVLLGAGLDTFAQRRPALAARLTVFEVDQPGTQAWKRRRLLDLGYGVPGWLRLVPVDFEAGASWRAAVARAGSSRRTAPGRLAPRSSASSARPSSSAWPARPASPTSGTCPAVT
jgi:methyltransferase (TIGR00027 family)